METNRNVVIKIMRHDCGVQAFPLDELREVKVMRKISNVSISLSTTSGYHLTSFSRLLLNYLMHSITTAIIVMSASMIILQMCADISDFPDLILEYCAFGDLAIFIAGQCFQRVGISLTHTHPS
jgi:hypothetical protein